MNFTHALFEPAWSTSAHVLLAVLLVLAVWRAPWWRLRDSAQLHVLLGAAVILMGLWSVRAGIRPGLDFHLLGATALTLMFGWALALLALALVVLAVTLAGSAGADSYSLNVLVMGAVPVFVTVAIRNLVARRLPRHFFIYIFVTAFLGAALAIGVTALVASGLLAVAGIYPVDYLTEYYLPYFLLLAIPEGVLTGSTLALMVVYRPHWVDSFEDALYLDK